MINVPYDFELLKLRLDRNLSQNDLAILIDLNVATISNYERDNICPNLKTFVSLCKVLNCDPNDLLKIK